MSAQVVFMNLRRTVRWLGVEVRDPGGNLIPNVTAISPTSGIDWVQPVPEPVSGLVGLAALGGLLVPGRARRRR